MTVNKLLLIGQITEEDWSKSNYDKEKMELESTITFYTIVFCVFLRGEEVPLIVIEGLNILNEGNSESPLPSCDDDTQEKI